MKQVSIILFICLVLACAKDEGTETPAQIQKPDGLNPELLSVRLDDKGRDGKLPFDFVKSQVIMNPFVTGRPEIAFNTALMDSVRYIRFSTSGANINGVICHKYLVKRHFGDAIYEEKVYAPMTLGSTKLYTPPYAGFYPQLDAGNTYDLIRLEHRPETEQYFDMKCGVEKFRYRFYIFNQAEDTLGYEFITGDRCGVALFSFSLVF